MLQVIDADKVKPGEPRYWLGDGFMRWDFIKGPGHLHLGNLVPDSGTTHAVVDRPAPTPTPDPLATVRAALDVASKATPGEWKCDPVDVFGAPTEWSVLVGPRRPGSDWPRKSDLRHEDVTAIVAMHNAAPAIAELCAEVERLRAERDSARDSMATAHVTAAQVGDELIATRAKLAEAKRLGMEACGIGRACVKADCECRIGTIRAALEAL